MNISKIIKMKTINKILVGVGLEILSVACVVGQDNEYNIQGQKIIDKTNSSKTNRFDVSKQDGTYYVYNSKVKSFYCEDNTNGQYSVNIYELVNESKLDSAKIREVQKIVNKMDSIKRAEEK